MEHTAIGTVRSFRDMPPAHYTFKIEAFSFFITSNTELYESGVFEAGGYKWKMSLYPNGNKRRNASGHISLHLAIADIETLPPGWEVNVNFKFFVFDHVRDRYLTIQENDQGGIRRYHRMKTQWGIDQLVSTDDFNDPSNGYLLDDCCVLGVEVFPIASSGKGECASLLKDPPNSTYIWKIEKFKAITNEFLYSEEFVVGGHKWMLKVFPKGYKTSKGQNLSVSLELNTETLPVGRKVYAEYKLRVRDQYFSTAVEKEGGHWFSSSSKNRGYLNFMSLKELYEKSKGFWWNDSVVIEGEITLLFSSKDLYTI